MFSSRSSNIYIYILGEVERRLDSFLLSSLSKSNTLNRQEEASAGLGEL
jgi:hypothetical protein